MTQSVLPRSQIPAQYTWDTEAVYASHAVWEAELARVAARLPELASAQGRLGASPAVLAEWLESADQLMNAVGRLYFYASMFHNVDTADQAAVADHDRAIGLYSRAIAALAFAEPELLAIGFETLRRWAAEEPRLATYAHYFDQLERRQAHVRSAEVEELLGQVRDPFSGASGIHSILADADLDFAPARTASGDIVALAQGNISALLTSPDRDVRRTAWESYADAHLAMQNTMAACLATGVKQDVFMARARRYGSSLEASLVANNIPVEVFHNLIDTYRRNLPTWHRYWNLRRRALGYDALYAYDIKAPLTANMPKVPLERSIEWICAGMRPLGEEYVAVMRDGLLEQRWVDVYPNQGKRMGAYSHGVHGTHPYILMSYNDDIFSMSTLAHELGHSMHSFLTWQNQPLAYSDYSLFVAEVASNFNQALVRAHLLATNKDPDFQIAVIEEAMANFYRYFFIMPTLARFELEIHERIERGEALTAASLIDLMADLLQEGYGAEVQADRTRVGSTWCQFSTHLYANFYVYQYATGIAAANALAADILAGQDGAVENYLAFLKSGGSLYPLDALKLAGVDMATPAPVDRAFEVLASYVERLEQLVESQAA
ncbi:MAG TPA: oligoendopeptidase F [Roseiflexaceae bacterium]|nr:oligoendopeptidase F [Roseiflexaceae bacterium]